jgi:hypothetical protein
VHVRNEINWAFGYVAVGAVQIKVLLLHSFVMWNWVTAAGLILYLVFVKEMNSFFFLSGMFDGFTL